MNEARSASLSSGLLARKGTAKPAMRPQGYTGGFDDLGWNDMGGAIDQDAPPPLPAEHVPSSISALTPLPRGEEDEHSVAAQQRALAESFAEDAAEIEEEIAPEPVVERAPAEIVTMPKRPAAAAAKQPVAVEKVATGKKAAFTLRLDAERHLKLRLACAVTSRSAQQLVAGALDAFLETIPEIDALAARVPGKRR